VTIKPGVGIPLWLNTPSRIRRIPSFCVFPQTQRGITAKLLINVAIIFGIVFVHAWCFKDRVQVQRRDAQFFQVRQFFADPVQIATVKRRSPPAPSAAHPTL
jgi:hypothetical protein